MTIHTPTPEGGRIVEEPMGDALSKRYLAYALSTITNRALPDVRDGFKPVHRRIMYAMHQMRLNPQAAARKCAKVVGEVMGGYHPHGDASIYEALVRLAQDFAQRYPLVDGQGNFGNIDGDSAAAMRYTECKLTPAAVLLLDGIDQDAVDFRPTYDDQDEEPVVLPAGFPNLLANGSSGIAVGMATSIPPHNVGELIDACQLLLERPEATTAELVEIVPGPDFPTGGVSVEGHASILDAYETGRGGVRLRARWETEDLGRGVWRIIVTEMPYQVQKSRLIEGLADLIENKKAPLLGDVRDESAEDIRLILEPKNRTIEPEMLMESLFRLTDLESRFSLNLNVLDKGAIPKVMSLGQALKAWLEHPGQAYPVKVLLHRDSVQDPASMHAGTLQHLAGSQALAAQVVTGLLSDDEIAFAGPLTRFVSSAVVGQATGYHKDIGQYLVLGLVALHLLAIVFYVAVRRQRLVRPMLQGDKHLPAPAAASRDDWASRLAALLVLAASAGLAWWVASLGAAAPAF